MFKTLRARLQQYVSQETPDIQAGFPKRQRTQRSNCQHPLDHGEIKEVPEKSIYFCSTDYTKAFDCVDHNKLWKILKRDGSTRSPDLRNVFPSQETTVRTGHEQQTGSQLSKEYDEVPA